MSEGHTERLETALAGQYRIERKLGEGGMASVYLAEDIKHKRKVALKILRPELAAVIGADRFLAEIQTTANLQHPHILALFDSGNADGYLYYVMPFIDGETLREKLDREKQLGVEEAVRIARDVADALDYAHRHEVIHRDIKPGNILLHDGRPVVADFGIALAVSAAGGGRMTETGLSLGTPHYMSPEQASADRDLSVRSDVYSLGCVLYEMIAGQPPHTGPSAQSILVRILTEAPRPLTELRHTVPPHVAAVVAKSIEKLPADRFETAKSFMEALGDEGFTYVAAPRTPTGTTAASAPVATVVPRVGRNRPAAVFASLFGVTALALAWTLARPGPAAEPAPVRRFAIDLPAGGAVRTQTSVPISITADGETLIVNVATAGGGSQLFLRSPGDLEMVPIRGTEGVGSFFASPDGSWLGLNTQGAIVRVPAQGGPTATIVETRSFTGFRGASWADNGSIVYANADHTGLLRVREVGGIADTLTIPVEGETHGSPHALPGGETILFEVVREGETQVAVLSVASGEYELLTTGTEPHFVDGGFLVFRREGALWAAPFDPTARTLEGDPVPVVEGLLQSSGIRTTFALSRSGTLVFAEERGTAVGGEQLVVVGMDGTEQALPLTPRPIPGLGVGWSPDGESVVYTSEGHIYTYNVVLNTTPRQITFEGDNQRGVYSPDGTRVVFSSVRDGTDGFDLFVKDLNDNTPPRSLMTLDANQFVLQWPMDSVIVFERGQGGVRDLWLLDVSDPESPEARPYLTSEADLERLSVSPDGSLAAYRSNESGVDEIYIRSFPVPGERIVVSRNGGHVPFWSPDGATLYYAIVGGTFAAARLQIGSVPVVLRTDTLFVRRSAGNEPFPGSALHPDGDRFILAGSPGIEEDPEEDTGARERLVLVQNLSTLLRERLGGS